MKHTRLLVTLGIAAVMIAACSKKKETEAEKSTEKAAPVDPEAPSVVIAMIEAHGGMATWRTARTVSFESEFAGPEDSAAVVTRVMMDPHGRRAYADVPNSNESMAWDGKRAWSSNWSQYFPPITALMDYYLVTVPWLTMDPGVHLSVAGKDTLWEDPTQYSVVKMSFRGGAGGAPSDTYRLYIDPESKRLKATRFHVTYRLEVPDSTDAMPEHIVVYDDFATVDGLVVPTRYTIYRLDHSPIGTSRIRDWSFDGKFDETRMTPTE